MSLLFLFLCQSFVGRAIVLGEALYSFNPSRGGNNEHLFVVQIVPVPGTKNSINQMRQSESFANPSGSVFDDFSKDFVKIGFGDRSCGMVQMDCGYQRVVILVDRNYENTLKWFDTLYIYR